MSDDDFVPPDLTKTDKMSIEECTAVMLALHDHVLPQRTFMGLERLKTPHRLARWMRLKAWVAGLTEADAPALDRILKRVEAALSKEARP